MCSSGEPLTHKSNDTCANTRQAGGEFQDVNAIVQPATRFRLVFPGYAEQVERVQVPQADVFQLGFDLLGDETGVTHLCEGGDDDVLFPYSLQCPFQTVGMER